MDGSYGKKLGEWISLQRGERITSVSFSSPECFLEYHNGTKQDIVLLGRGFYDNPQIREEISVNAGETLWVYLHDGEDEVQIADSICRLPAWKNTSLHRGFSGKYFRIISNVRPACRREQAERRKSLASIHPDTASGRRRLA